jgi:hypothetical protein
MGTKPTREECVRLREQARKEILKDLRSESPPDRYKQLKIAISECAKARGHEKNIASLIECDASRQVTAARTPLIIRREAQGENNQFVSSVYEQFMTWQGFSGF